MGDNKVKVKTNNDGIGFLGLLIILFIALKLCNVISWSWFWVLFPVLVPTAVVTVFIIMWALCTLIKLKE